MENLKAGIINHKQKKSFKVFSISPFSIFHCVILLSILFACNQKTTNGKTLLVDVRPEGIWKQGHASDGVNIPLSELEKHKSELLKYDTVIFVCETGVTAEQATSYMNTQKKRTTIFKNGGSWTDHQDEYTFEQF